MARVAVMVPEVSPGSSTTLTPAQRPLTFNIQTGSTSNPLQMVFVSTDSTLYSYFTASTSASWLGVAAAAWIAPSASQSCFAPGLFYAAVDATGLSVVRVAAL